jgi:hypothetical protein
LQESKLRIQISTNISYFANPRNLKPTNINETTVSEINFIFILSSFTEKHYKISEGTYLKSDYMVFNPSFNNISVILCTNILDKHHIILYKQNNC